MAVLVAPDVAVVVAMVVAVAVAVAVALIVAPVVAVVVVAHVAPAVAAHVAPVVAVVVVALVAPAVAAHVAPVVATPVAIGVGLTPGVWWAWGGSLTVISIAARSAAGPLRGGARVGRAIRRGAARGDAAVRVAVALPLRRSRGRRRALAGARRDRRHPAIPELFECRALARERPPFLAMSLARGRPASDFCLAGRTLRVAEVIAVGQQIADALAILHARGIIHRDVNASNVVIERGAEARATLGRTAMRPSNERTHWR